MTTESAWFVGLLCDVSLKALVLAAVAAAGLWLFRVRSTSVQHRVWLAVMVAMLALPLLVAATPAVPLPSWAYPNFRIADSSLPEPTAGNSASGQVEQGDGRAVRPTAWLQKLRMRRRLKCRCWKVQKPSKVQGLQLLNLRQLRSWSERACLLAAIVYVLGLWLFASRLAYGVLVCAPAGAIGETY